MSKRGIALLILAAAAVGLLVYSQLKRGPLKVSGFVEAYEIRVGSRVGGRVQKVFIDEGDHVKQGQPLVALEPFDFREKRSQSQAELEARTADYEKLVKGFRAEEIAQAKATYDQLAARLTELVNGPRKEEIVAAEARCALPTLRSRLLDKITTASSEQLPARLRRRRKWIRPTTHCAVPAPRWRFARQNWTCCARVRGPSKSNKRKPSWKMRPGLAPAKKRLSA